MPKPKSSERPATIDDLDDAIGRLEAALTARLVQLRRSAEALRRADAANETVGRVLSVADGVAHVSFDPDFLADLRKGFRRQERARRRMMRALPPLPAAEVELGDWPPPFGRGADLDYLFGRKGD